MSQTALLYPANAAPLEIGTRHIPTPADDQMLVKVLSAAMNPSDSLIQLGRYMDKFPAVLGSDIAGTVEKLGSSVTGFAVGDKVFFQANIFDTDQTGFQQYALANYKLTAHVPRNLTLDQAASIPLAFMTAFVAFFHQTGWNLPAPYDGQKAPVENESIFIAGGSSGVGMYGIQLAKMIGFKRIVTTVSLKNADFVKSLGATDVIDRSSPNVIEQVRAIVGDKLTYSFDAFSSRETQLLSWIVLSDTIPGSVNTFHPPPKDVSLPAKPEGSKWLYTYGSGHIHPELGARVWQVLGKWFEEGTFVPLKTTVLGGLTAVPEGIQKFRDNTVSAEKLIIHPWE